MIKSHNSFYVKVTNHYHICIFIIIIILLSVNNLISKNKKVGNSPLIHVDSLWMRFMRTGANFNFEFNKKYYWKTLK